MPIIRKTHSIQDPQFDKLKDILAQEWRSPQQDAKEPVIIEEGDYADRPSHLYVVWNAWSEIDEAERSAIIMDAYEDVYGRERLLSITLAMGLTTSEAKRMGIEFVPVGIAA